MYQNQQFTITIDTTSQTVWFEYVFSYWKSELYWLQVIVPFSISAKLESYGPQEHSWSWAFVNVYPYGAIIRLSYNVTKADESWKFAMFSQEFKINQTLLFRDRGTYTLTLPYGATEPIQVANQEARMTPSIGIHGDGTARNIFKVIIPAVSILIQAIPANPSIEIPVNRNSLITSWDVGHHLPVVVVTYSLPNEVAQYSSYSLLFGLLIGAGIGVTAEGALHCYEEKVHVWFLRKLRMAWKGFRGNFP